MRGSQVWHEKALLCDELFLLYITQSVDMVQHQVGDEMDHSAKEFIESEVQSPLAGQRFYRDDNLSGFAVRVTAQSKSFILEKRIGGINRRITIGRCDEIDLDTAKTQACIKLSEIAKGNDPRTGKRINTLEDNHAARGAAKIS
jgi:hypothetical protein